MITKSGQKVNEKKKYSEPSVKEIGKINSITFGGVSGNADSGTETNS